MKNIAQLFSLLIFSIFCPALVTAQANLGMTYQSVIRNSSNSLVSNAAVGVKISIYRTSPAGNPVFVETHSPTTNANGLATFIIGAGTLVSGNYNNIDWGADSYFLKTETDPTGGNSYTISNTSQLMSVPYALYAEKSGNAWNITGNDGNATDFIGNKNDEDVVFKRNNDEKIRITSTGISMPQEIKPNNVAGQNGQVLTSNGDGTMAWKNAAYNNNTRFFLRFNDNSVDATGDFLIDFLTYNTNATDVVINAATNSITITKSGLYHFDLNVNGSVTTSANPANFPLVNLFLSVNGSNRSILLGNFDAINSSGSNWRLRGNESFDMHIFAPATIRLTQYSFNYATKFYSINLKGHLINE